MRPIILVDCDGVLADFVSASLDVLRTFGIDKQHDDVKEFDFAGLGMDKHQRKALENRWREPGFCASIKPYDGALEGLRLLRTLADVYAVTAPMNGSVTWQGERAAWLSDHMEFQRDHIVSTAAKHLVNGDVLIEDNPDVLTRWADAGIDRIGMLWSRPYNAASDWTMRNRWTGSDWQEVCEYVVDF